MKDSQKSKTKRRFYKKKATKPLKIKSSGDIFIAKKKAYIKFSIFLIPLILLALYFSIYIFNLNVSQNIQRSKIIFNTNTNFSEYPVVINSYLPYLTAKTAIILDADSQAVIFSKNPLLRFSMASTVKIMTAYTALEYYNLDSVLTVQSDQVEGSGLMFKIGEKFYFEDLLYAMLLPSANDAAMAIGDNYPGGMERFVLKMNEKASVLHLKNTHFEDPIGLDDDQNYTTVLDLSRLGSIVIKNKEIAKIVSTQQRLISNIDNTQDYNLINLNKLLGIQGVNGIKTGTTEGAGEVLVTSTVINNHTFIIVVMNSQDRFIDTQVLLTYINQNVKFISL